MHNGQIEQQLRNACKGLAPDVLSSVLADCEERKETMKMQENKKNKSWVKRVAGIAAALVLAAGVFGVGAFRTANAVDSTVMLDVNPSIEIEVNAKEKVLKVTPCNDDAKTVVGDMDFKGSTLDVTVNALIGSMLRNGYISDAANSILVSVNCDNAESGAALEQRLMSEIESILSGSRIQGAVLGQTVENDAENTALAQKYGISSGKAQLVRQIAAENSRYTADELAELTVNQLNLIAQSGNCTPKCVNSTGKASAASYVEESVAKAAALQKAGVSADEIRGYTCEMDWERGQMIYEIEFLCDGYEYEIDVNATTGEVISQEKDTDDDNGNGQQNDNGQQNGNGNGQQNGQQKQIRKQDGTGDNCVGEAAAKAAALQKAGVSADEIRGYKCELDRDSGKAVYEIEFTCSGYAYDCEINAADGSVISCEKELDD